MVGEREKQRVPQQLVLAAADIETKPPGPTDMAFLHSIMCHVGLPRSRVTGREWAVQCGDVWLTVTAGRLSVAGGNEKPKLQIIPYGAMPRLALAWVSTIAVRTRSREIPIGNSASEFLGMMGLDHQGNRYKTLREQMHALAACHLQLGYRGRTFNGQPVQQFDAWVAAGEGAQRALWPGTLLLSPGYYSDLITSAVPLDNRALVALKGSALSLDIYSWLAHRLHRISGGSTTLRWHHLRGQFGQGYASTKDFRRTFLASLQKVLAVYPQARVKPVTGGLNLTSSPPPVPFRGGPTK